MYGFNSIKELINTLAWAGDLLTEMFGKRKSFSYQYDQAAEIIDENRLNALIEKGVITQNGPLVEIDDRFLSFFEEIMDVNEEINISYINENIRQLKENINYYLQENSEVRKYSYLKTVKKILRKIGPICIRNIIDLNRNIDDVFKLEPNYKIKISKLKNYDIRRKDIETLIEQTEKLLSEDEIFFFRTALDEELKQITIELQTFLQDARHNLIETQKQIIDFLNQVKYQSRVIEKLRKIKYLKEQFELEEKSDIRQHLQNNNAVVFEARTTYPVKLSLDILQRDDVFAIIRELNKSNQPVVKPKSESAGAIPEESLTQVEEKEVFIDLEEMKNNFIASGTNLYDFVVGFQYPRDVSYEEKLTCFCQLLLLYDDEIEMTDEYRINNNTEYVMAYPRQT